MKENPTRSLPGIPVLLALLVLMLAMGWLAITSFKPMQAMSLFAAIAVFVGAFIAVCGLYMVEPNQAAVLSLFGRYVGTVKDNGLRWNNPFFTKRKVSLRVRNFESGKLKVNDSDGNPIEIAPEIAQAMLQRQQANAVIAARTRIVAGAVGMVQMALADLQKNGVVELDEERKAAMVSNLLVVLCSERGTQPVVNAGSLY